MEFMNTVETWQVFVLAGLILMIAEVFANGFILLPAGLGFLCAAYFTTLVDSLTYQVLILAIFQFVIIFLFNRFLKKKFTVKETPTNASSMIGKEVSVIEEIPADGQGYIKLYGDQWSAVSENSQSIAVGQKVIIQNIDGNKVIVKTKEIK